MVGINKFLQAQIRTKCRINDDSVFWDDIELEVHIVGNQKKIVVPKHKYMLSLEDLIHFGARVIRRPKELTKLEIIHAKNSTLGGIARWNRSSLPTNVYIANKQTIQRAKDYGKDVPDEKYIGRIGKYRTAVYPTVDEVLEALSAKKFVN